MILKKEIFREYDIRGIYGEDFDEETTYYIGKSFATKLKRMDNNITVVVGYDNRSSSISLEKELVRGLTESGINVIRLGLVTTPMYFFGLNKLNLRYGCMITASHNPKEYNGFKMSLNGINNSYGDDVIDIYNIINENKYLDSNNTGNIENINIMDDYINFIIQNIHINKKLKIVYDCGNGTTSLIADKIFNKLNIEAIPLFNTSDPTFPNHHPDPCEEENNIYLKKKVLETNADLGIGFDGDGDRVGVVDELGNTIETDKIMIVIWRAISNNVKKKKGLFDVKCSKALEDELIKLNIEPLCYRTGASYTKSKTYEENLDFGGEYSGHMYFRDRFNGHDDGIYNGLRIVEILSNTNKHFSQLLEGINKYYSTKTLNFEVNEDYKFKIIEDIKKYCQSRGYNILTIDGVKVLFDDGFALIRASNTSPKLTYRYESSSKEKLKNIEQEFNNILLDLKKKYENNI